MPTTATRRFTGSGLKPSRNPQDARTDAERLVPGTYLKGTLLGQFSTLTAAQDVQTLTVTGTPDGGSIYISFMGELIGPVLFSSTAAQLQTLLDAATGIGTANTVVTGGPLPGTPLVITFQGQATNLWQPLMLVAISALTGGTSPAAAITHTTPGRAAGGLFGAYDDGASNGLDVAKAICAYNVTVRADGSVVGPGGEWGESHFTAPIFYSGTFYSAELVGLDANAVADLQAKFLNGAIGTKATAGVEILIP